MPSDPSPAAEMRRARRVRVPGHLNNSQLERVLFGRRATRSGHIDGHDSGEVEGEADGEEDRDGGDEWLQAARSAPDSSLTSAAARYPLNKQLVVFVVRDLGRLCSYMPEHVRALIAADEDSELRAVAPQPGCVLTEAHEAFRLLVPRLLLRLTGASLSPGAVDELIAASASITRHSLTMDTRTRRTYLSELYVPGADNVALSGSVQAASEAFRDLQERSWFATGQNPLQQLRLTYPIQTLQQVGRMTCPKCRRKVSWYCPEDLCAVLPAEVPLPHVELPIRFDILHHRQENTHKSTSIHACILSPTSCRFLTLPHHSRAAPREEDEKREAEDGTDSASSHSSSVPPYDPATTLVLYPSPSALPLNHPSIAALLPNIQRVVVIESTWQKGGAVYSHPALALSRLQAVKLNDYESTYWRYQELGRHALCTLEAIYHFCRELLAIEEQRGGTRRRDAMRGTQLDDLLYLYAAQHSRLQTRYQQHHEEEEEKEQQQPLQQSERAEDGEAQRGSSDASTAETVQVPSAAVDASGQREQAAADSARKMRKKPPPRAWKPM